MIGIIGAMDEEVNAIIEKMTNVESKEKAGMTFNKGTLEGKETVVVRSGIGKVNAGLCTQILVDDYKIDAVINTGIAGSLKNQIDIGDIVLSSDALYHDMDATGFGYDFGVVPRMESSVFKGDVRLINLAKECCERVNPDINVHIGRVVSGDQFISDKAKKDWINEHFDGYCTEMEGAAIAHAATLNNIPFLIVRAISDKADNSATMDYGEFEKKAIIHSVNLIMEFVKNM